MEREADDDEQRLREWSRDVTRRMREETASILARMAPLVSPSPYDYTAAYESKVRKMSSASDQPGGAPVEQQPQSGYDEQAHIRSMLAPTKINPATERLIADLSEIVHQWRTLRQIADLAATIGTCETDKINDDASEAASNLADLFLSIATNREGHMDNHIGANLSIITLDQIVRTHDELEATR